MDNIWEFDTHTHRQTHTHTHELYGGCRLLKQAPYVCDHGSVVPIDEPKMSNRSGIRLFANVAHTHTHIGIDIDTDGNQILVSMMMMLLLLLLLLQNQTYS